MTWRSLSATTKSTSSWTLRCTRATTDCWFLRKPAPVQVSGFAYPGTTGMEAIDYRLTDPYLDPPGMFDEFYSEASAHLPDSFWCYDLAAGEGTEVGPLPAAKNGFVTFGCLNNFCKITDPTLDLWAQVLNDVSGSRLVLLAPTGSARVRLLDKLQARGVAGERVQMFPRQSAGITCGFMI